MFMLNKCAGEVGRMWCWNMQWQDSRWCDSNCPKFQQLKSPCQQSPRRRTTYTARTYGTPGSNTLLTLLALPQYGLSTVFVVSFISATLLPLGSEPVVFGLVKLNPDLFWPAIAGGHRGQHPGRRSDLGHGLWRRTSGGQIPALQPPPAGAGLAGTARPQSLPAGLAAGGGRPAVRGGRLAQAAVLALRAYMAIGKFARYLLMTAALMGLFGS